MPSSPSVGRPVGSVQTESNRDSNLRLADMSFGNCHDDSVLCKFRYTPFLPLRRRGSSESGFFRFAFYSILSWIQLI